MKAHVARLTVFFAASGLGVWAFLALAAPWSWIAFIGAFLVGGVASMLVFKRLASPAQRREALEARLYND